MRAERIRLPRSARHRPAALVGALTTLALVAGCGGDDDAADGGAAEAGVEADVADPEAGSDAEPGAGGSDHDCAATELSFTNHAAGRSGTATTALARSTFDDGLFEVHVADFDVTADDLRAWRPEVPEAGNVVTIQLTVFNASEDPTPIEPGASLELTIEPDELTFLVRHFTADDDWSTADSIGVDSVGTLDVTAVGDAFCFDIDYRDQDKEVAGSVAATVFERR